MNGKTSLSWIFLVAALAFPAVLFWNWWRMVNVHALPAKPASAQRSVFAPSVSSGATNLPGSSGSAPASAPIPVSVSSPASVAPAISSAAMRPAAGPSRAVAAGLVKAAVPSVVAAVVEETSFHPKTDRDPLLSPFGKKMMEEEMRKRRQALYELKHPPPPARKVVHRPKEPPIETRIQLMAIIRLDRPGSQPTATINGLDVRQGDVIEGLGVKVVKIGVNSVTFEYRKRRFVKSIR